MSDLNLEPIADMEAWIDQTLVEAVKEERDPKILKSFIESLGVIALQDTAPLVAESFNQERE